MNPLNSIKGTIALGFITAIIAIFALDIPSMYPAESGVGSFSFLITVWLHVLAGIVWIGLLYYFNFVQVPAMGAATADTDGPGPAAIGKYIAPKALLWFRMAAATTWLIGVSLLAQANGAGGQGILDAFLLAEGSEVIGVGAWLGTIMAFNVWFLIWPNQKKILGMVSASAEDIAKAKTTAAMASRTNVVLSVPMLLCMFAAHI
ncbi:urate hydroxylase PuuD [Thiomicrorhabdus sediminis]|uniref:Urate oxidase N-terminal domain-containing protein n=1 Tax=Thiomicrorhabdus sediminis TaxID=2580412 RepID=A0A4P9K3E0_9GAMM|nr:urate hydroxylase PuuD [Thiomicrorhabdus sediminis]QCU89348.1 hypothetical protein FE785_01225 [Thiomicrorhabdus sediminis]